MTIDHAPTLDQKPTVEAKGNRRSQIAAAALRILGEQGSRHLTHRAIDRHLDFPMGTTSAYFRRREDLVGAAVRALFESDFQRFDVGMGNILASDAAVTMDMVVDFFVGMVHAVRFTADDVMKLARYECFLLARRDPDTNRLLQNLFDAREARDAELFTKLGAENPQLAASQFGYVLRGVFFTLAFLPEPSARLDLIDGDFIRNALQSAMRQNPVA